MSITPPHIPILTFLLQAVSKWAQYFSQNYWFATKNLRVIACVGQKGVVCPCTELPDAEPLALPTDLKSQSLFYFNARRDITAPFSLLFIKRKENLPTKRGSRAPHREFKIYLANIFQRTKMSNSNKGSYNLAGKRRETGDQTEVVLGLLDEGLGAMESWSLWQGSGYQTPPWGLHQGAES